MDIKDDDLREYRDIIPQSDFVSRKVKVSIYCNTFNHEPYIRDALEGFINQKTDFSYQVFVYDDASTDGASEIIREYSEKYPDKIVSIIAKKNTYCEPFRKDMKNKIAKKYLTGDYIATCEGDDYWTNPHKLQMQVDYMDQHPQCVITCHDAIQVDYRNGERTRLLSYDRDGVIGPEDIILETTGRIPNASVLMRREFFFPDDAFPACEVGDWPRRLKAIVHGYVYYFNKPMSVYRYMHSGSWSSAYASDIKGGMRHRLRMIRFLKEYNEYSKYRFTKFLNICISRHLLTNALEHNISCSEEDYFNICRELEKEADGEDKIYVTKQKQLWSLLHADEKYIDQNLKEYIMRHERIAIMGTGKYARQLTKYLEKQGVEIGAYVVSNDRNTDAEWLEAPVWKIKDYPYEWDTTGMLIGVHPNWRLEIEQSLEKNGVEDWYAPYWSMELQLPETE